MTSSISLPIATDNQPVGETRIYRNKHYLDTLISTPFPSSEPNVDTPLKCFLRTAERSPENKFLGERVRGPDGARGAYAFESYGDVRRDVRIIADGLRNLGVASGDAAVGEAQMRVGVFSVNRPEWTLSLLSLWTNRCVCVPLYDSLGKDAIRYILQQAALEIVMIGRSKLQPLLAAFDPSIHILKNIVLFEEKTEQDVAACASLNISLSSLMDLQDQGGEGGEVNAPTPSDWAYVMYTSGTTGDPKGVVLTHQNVLASASALDIAANHNTLGLTFLRSDDVYISYLPLPHSFESMMEVCIMIAGACIGFFSGDPLKLVTEDIPLLKPTVMCGVPRVYNRIFDKVRGGVEAKGGITKALFNIGFSNQSWMLRNLGFRNPVWDILLFSKVRQALGGRIRSLWVYP